MSDSIDYFRDHWMKNVKLILQNVAELNVCTNNNVEGWNNRFNKRMNKHHPNMWAFVTCLQNEEVVKSRLFAKHFEDDEIDRTEHLERLSLLVASKNCTQSLLFISNESSSLRYIVLC